nr:hypothetical protein [Prevotella sp.]
MNVYKIIILFSILAVSLQGLAQKSSPDMNFHEGDLLFFANGNDNAITEVTKGFESNRIDHVAIVHINGKDVNILEATHKGVVISPKDSIFQTSKSSHNSLRTIYLARLKDTVNVANSVSNAMTYIGRPYDFYFDKGDSAIYCSELVQISYKDKYGNNIFPTIPMSFHNTEGKITDFWIQYYKKVNRTVPEGEPGSNPGDLSRNDKLSVIARLVMKNGRVVFIPIKDK